MGLVFLVELCSEGHYLAALEVGNLYGTPALGGSDYRCVLRMAFGRRKPKLCNEIAMSAAGYTHSACERGTTSVSQITEVRMRMSTAAA